MFIKDIDNADKTTANQNQLNRSSGESRSFLGGLKRFFNIGESSSKETRVFNQTQSTLAETESKFSSEEDTWDSSSNETRVYTRTQPALVETEATLSSEDDETYMTFDPRNGSLRELIGQLPTVLDPVEQQELHESLPKETRVFNQTLTGTKSTLPSKAYDLLNRTLFLVELKEGPELQYPVEQLELPTVLDPELNLPTVKYPDEAYTPPTENTSLEKVFEYFDKYAQGDQYRAIFAFSVFSQRSIERYSEAESRRIEAKFEELLSGEQRSFGTNFADFKSMDFQDLRKEFLTLLDNHLNTIPKEGEDRETLRKLAKLTFYQKVAVNHQVLLKKDFEDWIGKATLTMNSLIK